MSHETEPAGFPTEIDPAASLDLAGPRGGDEVLAFPPSYAQQRIYYLCRLDPQNPFYNVTTALRLSGPLQAGALERALQAIVDRHEALRTGFAMVDGRLAQVVEPAGALALRTVDLAGTPAAARDDEALRAIRAEAARPFDLARGGLIRAALLRLSEDEHVLVVVMHHVVCDGWSLSVFVEELSALYNAFAAGGGSPLPEPALQYADYAVWQREWLEGDEGRAQLAYWRGRLAGGRAPELELPLDRARSRAHSFVGARHSIVVPEAVAARLEAAARAEGATLFMALLAAFAAVLHRYSGQERFALGTPVAGRDREELERLIGFFVNLLVIPVDLGGAASFRELVRRVRDAALEAYAHQELPFELLVDELKPEREVGKNPLVQVFFALQQDPVHELDLRGLSVRPFELDSGVTRFDLELHCWRSTDGIRATFVYSTDLFDAGTVEGLAASLQRSLQAAVEDPGRDVREWELERPGEAPRPGPARLSPPAAAGPSLRETIGAALARHAEARAVSGPASGWTYAELDRRTAAVAHHLRRLGAGGGARVAVALPPSPEWAAVVLGALRAGATVAGLDVAATPPALWRARVEAAGVEVLVRDAGTPGALAEACRHLRVLEAEPLLQDGAVDADAAGEWDGAILVQGSRRPLILDAHTLAAQVRHLEAVLGPGGSLRPGDVVLHATPLETATGAWELLGALAGGARLELAAADDRRDVARRVIDGGATVAVLAPREIAALCRALEAGAAAPALRCVLSAGEPVSPALRAELARWSPARVVSGYAPEEAGRWAAVYAEDAGGPGAVRLGEAMPDTALEVLDFRGRPVPPGVVGELHVAGRWLARPASGDPAPRAVTTGERARRRADGALDLVGSADGRQWYRGRRIDPDEAADALLAEPSVRQCAAMVRPASAGHRELVAYVVPEGDWRPARVAAHVEAALPEWLRPGSVVPLHGLPLDGAGRPDRDALSRLPVVDAALASEWEARLRAAPGVSDAAAAVVEGRCEPASLHLSDLLPRTARPERPAAPEAPGAAAPPSSRPSTARGEDVELERIDGTLVDALVRAAERAAGHGVVCLQPDGSERTDSYPQLLEAARRIRAALHARGVKPAEPVLFQLTRNQDFLRGFWGCLLGGHIPVPLAVAPSYREPNAPLGKLINSCRMHERALVLAAPELVAGIRAALEKGGIENALVLSVDELERGAAPLPDHRADPGDPALFLLTSGSTGMPKVVQQTHRNLLWQFAAMSHVNRYGEDEVIFNWMPLDHVVGIVMCHTRGVWLGCRQIHAPIHVVLDNPVRWLEWVDRYRVTDSWAPNFAFGLVNDRADEIEGRSWDLSCLRTIINAGESVVSRTCRRFLRLLAPHGLPPTAMIPAWGMSETCSVVVQSDRFQLDRTTDADTFVLVGTPYPGLEIRLLDAEGGVVPEGTTGRLEIRGRTVLPGYYRNPQANASSFTAEGWFNTGDLGVMRDGCLAITGREKDVIIVRGANFYAHELEALVEELDGVETSFTAACGVKRAGDEPEQLAIFFHPQDGQRGRLPELLRRIRGKVAAEAGVSPAYLLPVSRETVPKTEIGKIQRAQLRARFAAGGFDDILQEVERLAGGAQTVPDFFLETAWVRCEPAPRPLAPGATLIFADAAGLGEGLAGELEKRGRAAVLVSRGAEFSRLSATRYRLAPDDEAGYRRLLRSLADEGCPPARIVHLWPYGGDEGAPLSIDGLQRAHEQGLFPLLFLLKALREHGVAGCAASLLAVTARLHAIGDAPASEPSFATLPGLLKTAARELAPLKPRHVDLEGASRRQDLDHLIRELHLRDHEADVAYRGGERLVRRLRRVDLAAEPASPEPIREGGVYLVTGGLGGVGRLVTAFLLGEHRARVLVVGRRPEPDAAGELEALGGELRYEQADVADEPALRQAVEKATASWGAGLDGVFHLAGVARECALHEETREGLQAALRAKVEGSAAVASLLRERPQALLVTFASVNGLLGGATVGAYSAASSFQEALGQHLRRTRSGPTVSIAWSMWDETGMSRGYRLKDLTRAGGFHIIEPRQGLGAFRAALCHGHPQLVIGLDAGNPQIRPALLGPASARLELHGVVAAAGGGLPAADGSLAEVRDRFGVRAACTLLPVASVPRRPDGGVDLEVFRGGAGPGERRAHQPPQDDLQRAIAEIWREVLEIREVGIHDRFFEVGGNSFHTLRVVDRLQKLTGRELGPVTLIEHPTIASLAALLREGEAAAPAAGLERRADRRRASMEQRAGRRRSE